MIVVCSLGGEESPKDGDGEGRTVVNPKRKRDGESEGMVKRNGHTRKEVTEDEDLPNGVDHAVSETGQPVVLVFVPQSWCSGRTVMSLRLLMLWLIKFCLMVLSFLTESLLS